MPPGTPAKLVPRIRQTKPTPGGTRVEYFLEAQYTSPASGKIRVVEASYKCHWIGDLEEWRKVPRELKTKWARNSTMSKKRALLKFDQAAHAVAKQAERARWHRRQAIAKAAGSRCVLVPPPWPGPHSGCALSQCMVDGPMDI